jgi:hypothetical protein
MVNAPVDAKAAGTGLPLISRTEAIVTATVLNGIKIVLVKLIEKVYFAPLFGVDCGALKIPSACRLQFERISKMYG